MADRRSVRAELERKKVQLAQMRQERERRSQMLQESDNSSRNLDSRERLEDADAVLHALGLSASLSRASTAPSNVSSLDQTRNSVASPDVSQPAAAVSLQPQQQQQPVSSSLNDSFVIQSTPRIAVPLQVVHVNQINIPPKEKVYYTKSTQTPAPIVPPQVADQSLPQGEAPQQKSYYGKQIPTVGHQNNPSTNNSLSNNTQVAGVNQLALEWDDEFPGMSRVVEYYEHMVDFGHESVSEMTMRYNMIELVVSLKTEF